MDNITHSLVGLACAEAITAIKPELRKYSRPILLASLIANNLPDLDFAYTRITTSASGERIGQILHHRGHTHTLAFALPGAAILAALLRWLSGFKSLKSLNAPFGVLFFAAALGISTHVFADSWNNYGVHPFWPFWNSWIYGDSLFIVDPLIWAIGLPFAYFRFSSKFVRALIFTLLGGLLYLMVQYRATHWGSVALWLVSVVVSFKLWRNWFQGHRQQSTAWVLVLLLIPVFFLRSFSISMDQRTRLWLRHAFGTTVLDVSLTPLPLNPFCWTGTSVETDRTDYVARRFTVAFASWLVPASLCPSIFSSAKFTADLKPVTQSKALEFEKAGLFQWVGETRLPLERLRSFYDHNCEFSAVMKFYRVPFIKRQGAGQWIVGDLRYDRSEGRDFPEMIINDPPGKCPRFVPNWTPPREDLLKR